MTRHEKEKKNNLTHLLVRRLVPVFVHSVHVDHRHLFGRFLRRRVEPGRFRYGSGVDRRLLFVRRLFFAASPKSFSDHKKHERVINRTNKTSLEY